MHAHKCKNYLMASCKLTIYGNRFLCTWQSILVTRAQTKVEIWCFIDNKLQCIGR